MSRHSRRVSGWGRSAPLLPGGGARSFGDSVTVVNVLGNVLRAYFGASLARQPDERYLSVEGVPFRFRRMTPASLAGVDDGVAWGSGSPAHR